MEIPSLINIVRSDLPEAPLKEAMLYQKHGNGRVLCQLCAHFCLIEDGQRGICQVRENRDGLLYTLVFGNVVTQNTDPIEKKPLYHFYPGTITHSIATYGCNLHCQYCTNWEISQVPNQHRSDISRYVSPEQIISAALNIGCQSIAYTYVEPTIFWEYVYEIACLARANGLFNIYKTNGFMTLETLKASRPYIDAANVDLKTFSDKTYHQFGGRLQPVLDSLKFMRDQGVWLEVTTLIIPGINDDPAELKDLAGFIAKELGVHTPWHIARFFPAYQLEHVAPTPIQSLNKAREIGFEEGLRYIYISNLLEKGRQDTLCHVCSHTLIERRGHHLIRNDVRADSCPDCGTQIPGLGMTCQGKNI